MSIKEKSDELDYSDEIAKALKKINLGCSFEFAVQGPAVIRCVFSPDPGRKVFSILRNADKIASELSVDGIRIVASIPELAAIGVEVPRRLCEIIRFEAMIPALSKSKKLLPVALGRTLEGEDFLFDPAVAPHVLVAGKSGLGKTMVLHSIICSLISGADPEHVQFKFAQTDGGWDLFLYRYFDEYVQKSICKTVDDAFMMLDEVVIEIERRMCLLKETSAKHFLEYNVKTGKKLPFLIIVIDGMAEVIMQDRRRFEVLISRITVVARFCGIHLVMTTNRISSDTITGSIKSNIPAIIALTVSNKIQSRILIDHDGAEKLLLEGDMLYYRIDLQQPIRIQGVLCGLDENE